VQGWFEDGGTDIEKLAASKGMTVRKGVLEFKPAITGSHEDAKEPENKQ
jgi:hypothetical protein